MASSKHIKVWLLLLLQRRRDICSGLVEGTVRDSHGAAVPNSTVALQREDGKTILTAKTDRSEGKFRFTALEAGEYTLKLMPTATMRRRFSLCCGRGNRFR